MDGGSEFTLEFEQACAELGISLFVLPPATPKRNGEVERANKTFGEDFYANSNILDDSLNAPGRYLQQALRKYNDLMPPCVL